MDQVSKRDAYLLESDMIYLLCDFIIRYNFPTFSGYQEKFYFNPGDTGFKVGALHNFILMLFCSFGVVSCLNKFTY